MRYLILILLIPLLQCKDAEKKVIDDILMDLLGTEAYYESPGYSPSLPEGVDTTRLYILKQQLNISKEKTGLLYAHDKKIVDSLQNYYDSILVDWYKKKEEFNERLRNPKIEHRDLVVIVIDTLIEPRSVAQEDIKGKRSFLKKEYRELVDLYLESDLEQKVFDYTSLTNFGRYKLYSPSSRGKTKLERRFKPSEKFVWVVMFSRVVFNENKDSAILYVSMGCKGDCGEGKLIYLKKKSGHWKIEDSDGLWVS